MPMPWLNTMVPDNITDCCWGSRTKLVMQRLQGLPPKSGHGCLTCTPFIGNKKLCSYSYQKVIWCPALLYNLTQWLGLYQEHWTLQNFGSIWNGICLVLGILNILVFIFLCLQEMHKGNVSGISFQPVLQLLLLFFTGLVYKKKEEEIMNCLFLRSSIRSCSFWRTKHWPRGIFSCTGRICSASSIWRSSSSECSW